MSILPPPTRPKGSVRWDHAAAWRHIDAALLAAVVALVGFGALMIYSATRHNDDPAFFIKRHALFLVLGIGVMVVSAVIDYRKLRDWVPMLYGGITFLLLAVLTPLGTEVNGTQGWFQIGSIQLQPSEFAKVIVIIAVASYLSHAEQPLDLRQLVTALLIIGVPMGLIMLQPDIGTVLVFSVIGLAMLLIGGVRLRHLVILILIGVTGVAVLLHSDALEDYQVARLTSFINPEDAESGQVYNIEQSQIAISTGGIGGHGFGEGPQTRGGFVPEQQTDFIFTVVGEELGFVGGATLILLFAVVIWRTWRAAQLARDRVGALICVGVLSMFVFQMFQSIGMSMGIMPVTGIPLPFISYGGSALLANCAAMGLVLNVHMRRFS